MERVILFISLHRTGVQSFGRVCNADRRYLHAQREESVRFSARGRGGRHCIAPGLDFLSVLTGFRLF